MADTKKDTKKVKTDEKAAETIVDEVTAQLIRNISKEENIDIEK